MHVLRNILVITLLAGCASACSDGADNHDTAQASVATPSSSTPSQAAPSAASMGPVDNACDLLTDAEVRQVFPKAASGKRNTESLEYGLDRCAWETPTGQIGVEMSRVAAADFEQELRAELQGAVDPRVNGALDRIRFRAVEGIGDHAIAVMEKADSFIAYVQERKQRPVLCFYLHPWEFYPMPKGALNFGESSVKPLPFIVKNCGPKAVRQLDRMCEMLKKRGGKFLTCKQLAAEYK